MSEKEIQVDRNEGSGKLNRNHTFDSLKLIGALLVVFIHCHYPYKELLLPVTEVAVPLFFAISGYFVIGSKRSWKRIRRIALIFVGAFLLYLFKTELYWIVSKQQFYLPTLRNVFDFVFFNEVAFSIHLWYLPAYLYTLLAAYLIDKYNAWRIAFGMIIPLVLLGACLQDEINACCPENIYFYRNAYFTGLPFFLLGGVVKLYPPISSKESKQNVRIKVGFALLLLAVLSSVRYHLNESSLLELLLQRLNLMFLVYTILIGVVSYSQTKDGYLSRLGRTYSLYIYIFHMIVLQVCDAFAAFLPSCMTDVYSYLNPFGIFILTIALSYLLGKARLIHL